MSAWHLDQGTSEYRAKTHGEMSPLLYASLSSEQHNRQQSYQ